MNNLIYIILVLSSAGLFFGYIDPKYSDVKVNRIEKNDYDVALANSHELQKERDKLVDKKNSIKEDDLNKLSKLIPDNIDNVRFIIDIENIAKDFGLSVRGFKADIGGKKEDRVVGKDTSQYGTLNLNFSTSASYQSFIAFIKSLESSLRLIDVVGIEFSSTDTSNLYDFNVTVRTYWLK